MHNLIATMNNIGRNGYFPLWWKPLSYDWMHCTVTYGFKRETAVLWLGVITVICDLKETAVVWLVRSPPGSIAGSSGFSIPLDCCWHPGGEKRFFFFKDRPTLQLYRHVCTGPCIATLVALYSCTELYSSPAVDKINQRLKEVLHPCLHALTK